MVARSPRSLAATISMSAPLAATARKKLRPIRPNPLMPTRTVTAAPQRRRLCLRRRTYPTRARAQPAVRSARRPPRPPRPSTVQVSLRVTAQVATHGPLIKRPGRLGGAFEHLGGDVGLGVRDAQLG